MGLQQSLRRIDGDTGGLTTLDHAPAHDHDRSVKTYFDHEKLDVYQEAIAFCGWVGDLLSEIGGKAAAKDHLDRASTSLPLNIAEGNGKFSDADRSRFLEIARGSALECAACLDVLAVKKVLKNQEIADPKTILIKVVSMLVGLIKAVAPDRVYEEPGNYVARLPKEQVKVKE